MEFTGLKIVKMKGSHVRLKADDGRVNTVQLHEGRDLPKGLLRKIIKEDLGLSLEEFWESYSKYQKSKRD